jgi:hypothetical protein
MKVVVPTRPRFGSYLLSLLGLGVAAAVAGLAFAGWMEHAPAILTTLTQEGLAWCL